MEYFNICKVQCYNPNGPDLDIFKMEYFCELLAKMKYFYIVGDWVIVEVVKYEVMYGGGRAEDV